MLEIYDLKTENLVSPLGIDARQPRFSWKIRSSRSNVVQTSYQIVASSDPAGKNAVWDSGRISSDSSHHIPWRGPSLSSEDQVYWKVSIETNHSRGISAIASFEMGLLESRDWVAKWVEPEEEIDPDKFKPAPYLRKEFFVKPGLVKARIYQSAHGLYDFFINGKNGTEDVFKPGFTSYYHRTQYQVYDIKALLTTGNNCWAVMLGDGWWRGITGGLHRNNFGYKLSFIGQIVLEFKDGTREVVTSDENFRTAFGGHLKADMKEGTIFNAQLEPQDWKEPGFDDSSWGIVHPSDSNHNQMDHLIASRSVPIRENETFNAQVLTTPNGETVLDFGQNIAGYVRMKLRDCEPGQSILLVHGETLDENGNFTQKNIQNIRPDTKLQQVEYTARGRAEEEYCPMFSVFGFQYVLIKGYNSPILPGDFVAVAVYSDLEEIGDFTCSHPLINQLVSNSRWSQKSNFLDVPTDCPTRERSPWTGDSQIYVRTAAYFMNIYPFFEKWLLDLRAEQFSNGKVPNTVPSTLSIHNPEERRRQRAELEKISDPNLKWLKQVTIGDPVSGSQADGSSGWGDTATITPYALYLCYGDPQILKNQYESAKLWVEYIRREAEKTNPTYADQDYYQDSEDAKFVWDSGYHWGEWLEPDLRLAEGPEGLKGLFDQPQYLVATMYFYYSADLVSKMAKLLGRSQDENKFRQIALNVKRVYNKYFIKEDGTIIAGRQAPNVRALAFDLVAEDKQQSVANKLAQLVVENGYRLNTGFLATPFLLPVLTDFGFKDIAFKVLEQEESPGWLCNVKAGATTILEDWQGFEKCRASFNHYSFGAVCEFLYSRVAGIQPQIDSPGYKHFIIAPTVGGTLTEVHAKFESPYGLIASSWKRNQDEVDYYFSVPANTRATIKLSADQNMLKLVQRTYPDAVYERGQIIFSLGSGCWRVKGLQTCSGEDGK